MSNFSAHAAIKLANELEVLGREDTVAGCAPLVTELEQQVAQLVCGLTSFLIGV
jgi:hypothetical protein